MAKNINYVSHKKSKVKVNGKPQLPSADSLVEGEIAVNFAENVETLSIKNESGAVVTFSSDNYYSEQKLGSAFTGANSAVTVTDELSNKANTSDIANFFDDAKYEDSGTTKVINFYHGNTIKATIDASDFIKDGMISGVTLESKSGTTYLVINWNTDAGIQTTELNIGDLFEADNYYNKTEIDDLVGSGFTSSSITDVIIENEEIVSNALIDLDERKLDASAYTPTDLSNYYTKSETSGKTEIANALSGKANVDDVEEMEETLVASITDIESRMAEKTALSALADEVNEVKDEVDDKLDATDAYTKTEIDNMIGDIETLLAAI